MVETIEDLHMITEQRRKVLKALGFEEELNSGSERHVKETLQRLVGRFGTDHKSIVVLPLGYDNYLSFCSRYDVYVLPTNHN